MAIKGNSAAVVKRLSATAKFDYNILKSILAEAKSTEALCKQFMRLKHGSDWRKLVNAAPVNN